MSSDFNPRIRERSRAGTIFKYVFLLALVTGILSLLLLLFNIVNNCFGFVIVEYEKTPAALIGEDRSLDTLPGTGLAQLLEKNVSPGLLRKLESEKSLAARTVPELAALVEEYICKPAVKKSWNLWDSLFKQEAVKDYLSANHAGAALKFRAWVNPGFITQQQSSVPEKSGIRTAILGSLWMILITLAAAFPMGIATAVYLEEYAADNWLNRLIQVNIYNLAGIPSIIYGLFGLAVFVRFMEPFTSGKLFGVQSAATANGRTILSAGLTLAMLILPVIIINTQEAIKAIPASLRYSSYGLGATKWQTIRHHVLPGAMDRILTGTILAVSRALGETAPLVVVGASTFITLDPATLFSQFTVLPIQIYQWTARPQATFKNIAAAAILVLVVLLLALNATAIILRYRLSAQRSSV